MESTIKPSIELSPLWSVQRKKIKVKNYKINIHENFTVNEWTQISKDISQEEPFNIVIKKLIKKGWSLEDISPVGHQSGSFIMNLYRVTPTDKFDNFLDEIIAEKLTSSNLLRSLKPSRMVFMAVLGLLIGLLLGLLVFIIFRNNLCSFLKINDFLIF